MFFLLYYICNLENVSYLNKIVLFGGDWVVGFWVGVVVEVGGCVGLLVVGVVVEVGVCVGLLVDGVFVEFILYLILLVWLYLLYFVVKYCLFGYFLSLLVLF